MKVISSLREVATVPVYVGERPNEVLLKLSTSNMNCDTHALMVSLLSAVHLTDTNACSPQRAATDTLPTGSWTSLRTPLAKTLLY